MECKNSKEGEFLVDIEIGEANRESYVEPGPDSDGKWGKKSLNKLVSGVLGFNRGGGDSMEYPNETTRLLAEECQGNIDNKKKFGKINKAAKPPRPPRGPALDASDIRMIKEFSRIAMKKRERIERIKALKRMRASRMSSSSSSLSSSVSSILAMVITILFFLVLIFQGLGSGTSTNMNMKLTDAPQPAPETRGLAPVQSYEAFLPPESTQ